MKKKTRERMLVSKNGGKRRKAMRWYSQPNWMPPAAIDRIIRIADELTTLTGVKHSVDHVWPLQGDGFCGLTVPWNLQVMPAGANNAKGNSKPTEVEWLHHKNNINRIEIKKRSASKAIKRYGPTGFRLGEIAHGDSLKGKKL